MQSTHPYLSAAANENTTANEEETVVTPSGLIPPVYMPLPPPSLSAVLFRVCELSLAAGCLSGIATGMIAASEKDSDYSDSASKHEIDLTFALILGTSVGCSITLITFVTTLLIVRPTIKQEMMDSCVDAAASSCLYSTAFQNAVINGWHRIYQEPHVIHHETQIILNIEQGSNNHNYSSINQ